MKGSKERKYKSKSKNRKEKKTRKIEEAAPFLSVLQKEKNHLSAISYFKIDGIFDTQAIKSITFHEMLR